MSTIKHYSTYFSTITHINSHVIIVIHLLCKCTSNNYDKKIMKLYSQSAFYLKIKLSSKINCKTFTISVLSYNKNVRQNKLHNLHSKVSINVSHKINCKTFTVWSGRINCKTFTGGCNRRVAILIELI